MNFVILTTTDSGELDAMDAKIVPIDYAIVVLVR